MAVLLIPGLALWVFGCAFAGYHRRFILFALIVMIGMTLNAVWMGFGLGAHPLSPPAKTSQLAALMYAISGVGFGWLAGSVVRGWRASRIDET